MSLARDLVDLEVDLAHGVRVADDVLGPELLLQGTAKPQVLRLQVLPLEGLDAARLDIVGDHAGDDPQEPRPSQQLRERLNGQVNRQCADYLAAHGDGDAEKAAVGLLVLAAAVNAIGEAWFLGYPRDDGGLSRLYDAADDALAAAIAETLAFPFGNVSGNLHEQLAPIRGQEHDRSPDHAEFHFQFVQHGGQHLLLARLGGQQLSHAGEYLLSPPHIVLRVHGYADESSLARSGPSLVLDAYRVREFEKLYETSAGMQCKCLRKWH